MGRARCYELITVFSAERRRPHLVSALVEWPRRLVTGLSRAARSRHPIENRRSLSHKKGCNVGAENGAGLLTRANPMAGGRYRSTVTAMYRSTLDDHTRSIRTKPLLRHADDMDRWIGQIRGRLRVVIRELWRQARRAEASGLQRIRITFT
jgi:hypothetical protein